MAFIADRPSPLPPPTTVSMIPAGAAKHSEGTAVGATRTQPSRTHQARVTGRENTIARTEGFALVCITGTMSTYRATHPGGHRAVCVREPLNTRFVTWMTLRRTPVPRVALIPEASAIFTVGCHERLAGVVGASG